ncbi:MAG: hypothetical protein Q9161_001869 [Pseudevernia consocians]
MKEDKRDSCRQSLAVQAQHNDKKIRQTPIFSHELAPKNWQIHPTVTKGYMARHQLPVDEKVIYSMKDAGQSTAQYLHKSWQRSKKAVHDYWTQFRGVRAPPLDFFLQGPDEEREEDRPTRPTKATTPKATPNPIPPWMVAEGLRPQEMAVVGDGDDDDTGRTEEDPCAEPCAEAGDISQDGTRISSQARLVDLKYECIMG